MMKYKCNHDSTKYIMTTSKHFGIHWLQDFDDHFAKHEINNSRSSKSHLASSVLLLYSFMFDIYGIPITIYKMGFEISSPLEWSQSYDAEAQ